MSEDEETYVLTEQSCMQIALHDFGIEVNIHVAKAIKDRFLELMVLHGHVKKENKENE